MTWVALSICLLIRPVSASPGRVALDPLVITPAGEQTFWVERPNYAPIDGHVAASLAFSEALSPLQLQQAVVDPLVRQALSAHLAISTVLAQRATFSLHLPLAIYASGQPRVGLGPTGAMAVGDPLLAQQARLYHHGGARPWQLHQTLRLWVPISRGRLTSETMPRALPKIVLTGVAPHNLAYAAQAGVLLRQSVALGTLPTTASSMFGPELQLGAGLFWAPNARGTVVGPELFYRTRINSREAFSSDVSGMEVLLQAHQRFGRSGWILGSAVSKGIFHGAGTPSWRFLLRIDFRRPPPAEQTAKAVPAACDGAPFSTAPLSERELRHD